MKKRPSGYRKHPVGTRVTVTSEVSAPRTGIVVSNGRDIFGAYSQVEYDGGETAKVHPSIVTRLRKS